MSDISSSGEPSAVSLDALNASDPAPVRFRDRATPLWASLLSTLFSLGGGLCLFSVALYTVFLFDLVAVQGQEIVATLLTVCALVPILGIIIFEVGHARALAGFRYARDRNYITGKALLGVFAAFIFSLLNPLLVAPFAVGAFGSWLLCYVGGKSLRPEPMWEFIPKEAPSFLGGRDRRALELANARPRDASLLSGFQTALGLFALVGGCAAASWLVAREVLAPSATGAIALMTYWSVDAFAGFARQMAVSDPEREGRAASITILPPDDTEGAEPDVGLQVNHLTVRRRDGQKLLADLSFTADPGALIGLSGDGFSGKTLLMKAILAPHDLSDLDVEGRVTLNGTNLWIRSGKDQDFAAVLVPPQPDYVPGGGANNLSCFGGSARLERARKILKSLVFTSDVVERITDAGDVAHLSATERKAMAFARAFALRPRLYLFDRPEDGASEKLLGALANRAIADTKLGGIGLFATENRQLLDACDKLLMLQNGRLIEYAASSEVRARQSAGWSKFVTERDLDSEEALDAWLGAQFRRDGDEGNRRAVCMIANELLSVACAVTSEGDNVTDRIAFEFKHFAGHCQLRLLDPHLALSSGAMAKARAAAKTSVEGERLSPLAKVIRDALDVDVTDTDASRHVTVSIKTYDPRKQTQRKASYDDTTVR